MKQLFIDRAKSLLKRRFGIFNSEGHSSATTDDIEFPFAKRTWLMVSTGLIILVISGSTDVSGEERLPLPVVSTSEIRLVEGTRFCFAGYGSQSPIYSMGGELAKSESTPNPYMPSFQAHKAPYIKIGCFMDQIYAALSLVEMSATFETAVSVDNKFYNSIKFQTHSISIGYSFSIVPHLLYIDLGTVYSSTNYILGRYNSNLGADSESEPINADAIMLETSVNLYLTHYLFLNWLHQQSLDDTYVISYVNNLGISFLARF